MARTYTRILARHRDTVAGEVVLMTVEADQDVVIRDLVFNNTVGTPSPTTFVVQAAGGTRYTIWAFSAASSATSRLEARIALEPGDSLRVISNVAGLWHTYVTGFVFAR